MSCNFKLPKQNHGLRSWLHGEFASQKHHKWNMHDLMSISIKASSTTWRSPWCIWKSSGTPPFQATQPQSDKGTIHRVLLNGGKLENHKKPKMAKMVSAKIKWITLISWQQPAALGSGPLTDQGIRSECTFFAWRVAASICEFQDLSLWKRIDNMLKQFIDLSIRWEYTVLKIII